jgi:hypothetical protein
VGVETTGSWGGVTSSDPPAGELGIGFTAEVQGDTGSYSIGGGGFCGRRSIGPVGKKHTLRWQCGIRRPGCGGGKATLTVTAGAAGGGSTSQTNKIKMAAEGAGVGHADLVGILNVIVDLAYTHNSPLLTPPGPLVATVKPTSKAQASEQYTVTTVSTSVKCAAQGSYLFLASDPIWCDDPSVSVSCGAPNPAAVHSTANVIGTWESYTDSVILNPQTGNLGSSPLPAWSQAPNVPSQQNAGASAASCGLNGDYDTVADECFGAADNPAPGWTVDADANFTVTWAH